MPQIFFTDYVTPATSKMLFVRDFGWHRMPANVDRSEGIGPFYQILISVSGKGQFTHNDIVSELPPSTLLRVLRSGCPADANRPTTNALAKAQASS